LFAFVGSHADIVAVSDACYGRIVMNGFNELQLEVDDFMKQSDMNK
jgi:hypothetical protein